MLNVKNSIHQYTFVANKNEEKFAQSFILSQGGSYSIAGKSEKEERKKPALQIRSGAEEDEPSFIKDFVNDNRLKPSTLSINQY